LILKVLGVIHVAYRRLLVQLEAERPRDRDGCFRGKPLTVAGAVERLEQVDFGAEGVLPVQDSEHIVPAGFMEPCDL
jgi:hypothetical protein